MAHNASSYSKKDERGWPPMGTLRVSYDEREVWYSDRMRMRANTTPAE